MKKFFLFLVLLLVSNRAEAIGFEQTMEVGIGIFDAAEIDFRYAEENGKFDIQTKVKTMNLFDTIYPFVADYQSNGLIADKILPIMYQTRAQSRRHVREKKIFYDDNGIAYKRVSAKDGNVHEYALDNIETADAADLQSVFAELIYRFQKDGKCILEREIYDGKKHYRVIVEDKGEERRFFAFLNRDESAHLCSVYIENLKDNNDNILWDVSADKPIKLWVLQDKATKIPYVLEIGIDSTPLGALQVVPRNFVIK